jgi:hypothetical protein
MRRIAFGLTLALAFVFVTRPAQAQVAIDLGVKGGVAVAKASFDPEPTDINLKSRTGFVGGGFATFHVGELFFVQPEVLYSQKGAKEEDTIEGTSVAAKLKLDYLEIPVLFGAEFQPEGSKIMPRVFAGPMVAFEMSCKLTGEGGGYSVDADCDSADVGIDTKSVDFGVVFGAGLGFALENFKIIVDGRYNLGLTNLNDTTGDNTDVKSRAWQFMAGVAFPVGGGM